MTIRINFWNTRLSLVLFCIFWFCQGIAVPSLPALAKFLWCGDLKLAIFVKASPTLTFKCVPTRNNSYSEQVDRKYINIVKSCKHETR